MKTSKRRLKMKGKIIAFVIAASAVFTFAYCTSAPSKMGERLNISVPNASCDLPENTVAYHCNVGGL